MIIRDLLRAVYNANVAHASNDPSVFVHGAISATISGGSLSQSGSWLVSIFDSSGNTIIATNTMPVGTEQALIVRPTIPTSALATLTNITGTVNGVLVVATDGTRKGIYIVNDSTANLLVRLGTPATTASFSLKITTASSWQMPFPIFQGRIDAIWDATNVGAARVTVLN